MTGLFFGMYFVVVSALATLAWIVMKLADKVERLWRRCDDIDNVEFSGQIEWPVEPPEAILEQLRDYAGDEDDRKRQQLETIVRMADVRH